VARSDGQATARQTLSSSAQLASETYDNGVVYLAYQPAT